MQGRAHFTVLATILSTVVSQRAAFAVEPAAPAPAPATTAAPAPAAPAPAAPAASATTTAPPAEASAEVPAEEPSSDAATTEPAPPAEEPPPAEPVPEAEPIEPAAEPLMVAAADEPAPKPKSDAGLFAQGRIRIGGTIGFAAGGGDRNWFILGVGAGAFVLDGLELHADTTFWIGDPFVTTLTPGVRYVFHMVPTVKPYVGTFYRHYFVTGILDDTDSLGARAGVNFMMSPNAYVGGGIIYEHFLDDALFTDPDQFYPEIMIAFAF